MKHRIARYSLIAALIAAAPAVSADDHHGAPAPAAHGQPAQPAPEAKREPAPEARHDAAPETKHDSTPSEPAAAPTAVAQPPATPAAADHTHAEETPAITADAALAQLIEGNQRFTGGANEHPREDQNRRCDTFVGGQHPVAAILSCADSRVAPEILFDQGIGDLFVIRVAGNVADTDEIGTIEYGVAHLNIPLIVVIGHTKCGAVTAVVNGAKADGALAGLLSHIQPAADLTRKNSPNLSGAPLVAAAIRENVRQSMRDLLSHSPGIAGAVKSGKVRLVGAVYDIHSGALAWLETGSNLAAADAQRAHSDATPKADPATGLHDAPKHGTAAAPTPANSHAAAPAHTDPHATAAVSHDAPNGHDNAKPHEDAAKASDDPHATKDAPATAAAALPLIRKDNFLALGILLAGSSGLSMGIFHLMNQLKHRNAHA